MLLCFHSFTVSPKTATMHTKSTEKPVFVNFNAHRNRNNRKASASPAQEVE
jgi:hypothetical protein